MAEETVVVTEGERGLTAVVDGEGLGDLTGTTGAADAPRK
jgi:hypothetical protein